MWTKAAHTSLLAAPAFCSQQDAAERVGRSFTPVLKQNVSVGTFFFSPLSVFGVFFLHFCSPSGYTVPHHHRHRSHPARQQRGKRQQQPFPSVFHCHALKIAPKQLHHRLLNKWIYTPLQAFSWRHSTIRDWTQRKCETPSTQT